jgi:hypothetical protein
MGPIRLVGPVCLPVLGFASSSAEITGRTLMKLSFVESVSVWPTLIYFKA